MTQTVIYDVKSLLRDLDGLAPGLRKQLVKDSKDIAKPIASNIKSHIPATAPLSGMNSTYPIRTSRGHLTGNPGGRLAWGAVKPANQVQIKFRSGRSRYTAITSLLSIWITSPATAMADVAGKGGLNKSVKLTRRYAYKNDTRRHRVNGGNGGADFVRNLKSRGANDFVYPAVGDSIDDAQQEVKLIIDRYARMVNRKLN